jgi:hypothetical protein
MMLIWLKLVGLVVAVLAQMVVQVRLEHLVKAMQVGQA